jgi:hypothetical protein
LMSLMIEVIEARGYLSEQDIEALAHRLRLPASRVYGYLTQFGDLPKRPYEAVVRVCTGPACASCGSMGILNILREEAPAGVDVVEHPGLTCWHRSPAVSVYRPGEEAGLLEGLNPAAAAEIVAGAVRENTGAARPWSDVQPPDVETIPGYETAPWWKAAAEGELPSSWGPELADWVSKHPLEATQRIVDGGTATSVGRACLAAMEAGASGISPPPVLLCDSVGKETENSVSHAATRKHPRAVVAGAVLAAKACRAERVVFYVPWDDTVIFRVINEALDGLLPGVNVSVSVMRGPSCLPCAPDIGRAAVLQGMMLWQAAAEWGWGGARVGDQPLVILPAEQALKIPWAMEKDAREIKAEEKGHLVSLMGAVELPKLLEVPPQITREELFSFLGKMAAQGNLKAMQALGDGEGPVALDEAGLEGLESASGLLLLNNSTCMVAWAHYLAHRAEEECCGGCAPGRTAAAAISRSLQAVLRGQGEEKQWQEVAFIAGKVGELALCPRLSEVIGPPLSCVNRFADEYLLHAADGVCKAGSCALTSRTGT